MRNTAVISASEIVPVTHQSQVDQSFRPVAEADTSLLHSLDFLQLELTGACNLKCVHCYTESSPHTGAGDRLSAGDYQKLMVDAYELGARRVQFLGGEPTLNRELTRLVEFAKTVGYEDIEIYSNLTTHVTKELLDYASRMGVRFATTFHSCDPEREDAFTAVKGSLDRKLRNVRAILDRGLRMRSGVMIAGQPQSDIEATFATLRGMGITELGSDRIRDFGRGRQEGNQAQLGELCGNCWRGSLAIAANGTAYACPFSRDWPVGEVTKTPLKDILKGVALKSIRQMVFDDVNQRPSISEASSDCSPCGPCRPSGLCGPTTCAPCGPCRPSTCSPG